MSLINYRPTRSRNQFPIFPNLLDEFFNKDISNFLGTDRVCTTPSVNVIENDDNFTLEVSAPGYTKDAFELNLENDSLIVSGKIEETDTKTETNFTRREFCYGSFSRSFKLPDSVDAENIAANYANGILTVTVPKKEEAQPVKKSIKVS